MEVAKSEFIDQELFEVYTLLKETVASATPTI